MSIMNSITEKKSICISFGTTEKEILTMKHEMKHVSLFGIYRMVLLFSRR